MAGPLSMELELPAELLEHPREYGRWLDFLRNEFAVALDAEDTIVAFLYEKGYLIPGEAIVSGERERLTAMAQRTLDFLRASRNEIDELIRGGPGIWRTRPERRPFRKARPPKPARPKGDDRITESKTIGTKGQVVHDRLPALFNRSCQPVVRPGQQALSGEDDRAKMRLKRTVSLAVRRAVRRPNRSCPPDRPQKRPAPLLEHRVRSHGNRPADIGIEVEPR
jgi:hypothetical protein